MKIFLRTLASFLVLALIIIGIQVKHASADQNTDFCLTNGPYGNNTYVPTSTYYKGQTVSFCLRDNGRIPLFYGPGAHPWVVLDDKGATVFQPTSAPVTTQPQPSFVFFDTWDQRDSTGKQVKPGKYQVLFTGTVFTARPVPFTILPKKDKNDTDGDMCANGKNEKDNKDGNGKGPSAAENGRGR